MASQIINTAVTRRVRNPPAYTAQPGSVVRSQGTVSRPIDPNKGPGNFRQQPNAWRRVPSQPPGTI